MPTGLAASRQDPPRSATDRLITEFRASLERGELKPGDRLPPERDLAQRFGVSRPTVRSAIRTLGAMGIVRTRQGAGTFIADGPPVLESSPLSYLAALHGFTRHQMFEARLALEVAVAGFAASRATAEALISMSDETAAMFAALEDPDNFLVHDVQFHRAVAAAADNPVLAAMVEMVSTIFLQARRDRIRYASDLKVAAGEHRAIYMAIRTGDPERARQAMLDHLQRAERTQTEEDQTGSPTPEDQRQAGPDYIR